MSEATRAVGNLRVSIITAVRNAADVVPITLASVATQDYPEIEHIVVDGASTDATLEVVRRHGSRVGKLVSEPDAGVYDAFNKGLRIATGEVVAYLNAGDEYASPDSVSTMLNALRADAADAVFADVSIVTGSQPQRVVRRYSSASFTPSRLAFGFMPAHPTLFLRREVYQRVGPYDVSYRIAGDFELCLRVFRGAGVRYRYLPQVLVRMADGGLSTSGWRSKWTITREMQRACQQNAVPTSLLKLLMRLPVKALELAGRGA